eukprot:gb/GECG01001357.1/.p1 GENE.gb/GECG01001357.1/~~gb/GECG01001357.1/.p1  ORF type:complete len:398 (+),score=21.49 gb/GECG01001357.1/:1-1194(+)
MASQQANPGMCIDDLRDVELAPVNVKYTGEPMIDWDRRYECYRHVLDRATDSRRQHYEVVPFDGMFPWYRSQIQIHPSLMGYVDLVKWWNNHEEQTGQSSVLKILEVDCLRAPGEMHRQYKRNDHGKWILTDTNEDPWMEMKILGQFGGVHNVVTLQRVMRRADEPQHTYMAFPHYNGGELLNYIANREVPVEEDKVRDIFLEILEGVGYLHSLGVCHRDISPENVLSSTDAKTIAITDFGMAKEAPLVPGFPLNSGIVGKPVYMAPEVQAGNRRRYNGIFADMYSLGMTLRVMLLSCYFHSKYKMEVSREEAIQQLDTHRQETGEISEAAIDCVRRLTQLDPCARPVVVPRSRRDVSILDHLWLGEHVPSSFPRESLALQMQINRRRQRNYLSAHQ